jgi:hypothetical protein
MTSRFCALAILAAAPALSQALKPSAPAGPRSTLAGSSWKIERDAEGLLVTLRASAVKGGHTATWKRADYPTLALTCDEGRVAAFVVAEAWEKKQPLLVTFDDGAPASFAPTDRVGALYMNPAAFLARLQGRQRLTVAYGDDGETATFPLTGSAAALATLGKECPLPEPRAPRRPIPPPWTLHETVSPKGEEGISLVQAVPGAEIRASCGPAFTIALSNLTVPGRVGVLLVDGEQPLTLRLDDGPPETLDPAQAWKGSWILLPNAPARLASLAGHEQATVSFGVRGMPAPHRITFALRGLHAALAPHRATCGLPPEEAATP